jgi:hypothetical protein
MRPSSKTMRASRMIICTPKPQSINESTPSSSVTPSTKLTKSKLELLCDAQHKAHEVQVDHGDADGRTGPPAGPCRSHVRIYIWLVRIASMSSERAVRALSGALRMTKYTIMSLLRRGTVQSQPLLCLSLGEGVVLEQMPYVIVIVASLIVNWVNDSGGQV